MQFRKQPVDIPVEANNAWDPSVGKPKCGGVKQQQQRCFRHSALLPNSIRCIIAGSSNSGKTNLLINLIISANGLKFENVYVYSKTLWQPKYIYLKKLFAEPLDGRGGGGGGVQYHEFSSADELMEPQDVKANSIIVFDDVICEKNQEIIRKYYSLGRHRGVDSFYLTTTYARVGKHLIRDNCNFLIIFQQNELNLKHIYDDMGVGCHMRLDEFRKFCFECWRIKYGFVVIDLDSEINCGRYRKGFADYLIL